MNKLRILTELYKWGKISGYAQRNITSCRGSLATVEYIIPADSAFNLNNKVLIFFSDLHLDNSSGTLLLTRLKKLLSETPPPDWLIFGGDLITYACFYTPAMDFMKSLNAKIAKIAVYGNWDKGRRHWISHGQWKKDYERVGFQLLVNEGVTLQGIRFWGMDEIKRGNPEFKIDGENDNKLVYNCIISHLVDPVVALEPEKYFPHINLILCGHSHAGQIRIPWFGALKTSAKYWKKFEYGHFKHKIFKNDLVVSSGVGTSWLPARLFCDPEIVVIKFKNISERIGE